LFGASLAATLGLPYAFASHFAPTALDAALAVYRREFRPSGQLEQPYAIAGVNVIAADTERAAREQLQGIRRARAMSLYGRGRRGRDTADLTDEQADRLLAAGVGEHVDQMLTYSAVGTPAQVSDYLDGFIRRTDADEMIVAHQAPTIEPSAVGHASGRSHAGRPRLSRLCEVDGPDKAQRIITRLSC
jgi:alkanesulfonate monooxygenase SsuD/methylene tetrahydromethanopterin reductase-like flavin-dependent oxidoreductase (luciferase family)